MEIIPAIIPGSYEEIEKKVQNVESRVDTVQLDLLDGTYVDRKTWPFKGGDGVQFDQIVSEEVGMPKWDTVNYELDLMMKDPELDKLYIIGPTRVILHLGALTNPKEYFEKIDPYFKEGIEFGIAIRPHQDISLLDELIVEGHVKFVQCMGVDQVGYQGNPFDERVLEHIKSLRAKYPDLPISVDGAVNRDTAPLLLDAGATRLVVGSAIWNAPNPLGEIEDFQSM